MYQYKEWKRRVCSPAGQKLFLAIRDQVKKLLEKSGAVGLRKVIRLPPGIGAADVWEMMACVDRLVELKELREIKDDTYWGDRIFVKG